MSKHKTQMKIFLKETSIARTLGNQNVMVFGFRTTWKWVHFCVNKQTFNTSPRLAFLPKSLRHSRCFTKTENKFALR